MKRILMAGLLSSLLLLTGCEDLAKPENEKARGGILVTDLSAKAMKIALLEKNISLVNEDTTVYGQKAYKIPYTTTDANGHIVHVSGLMTVPVGVPIEIVEEKGLSLVNVSHSTIFKNSKAPSVNVAQNIVGSKTGIVFSAIFGFVTIEADEIGFGDSKDAMHPFVVKTALANTNIDFIKAARIFAEKNNIKLNNQLFLTGYSEGGHTALATLEKIEAEQEMNVTMAMPISGPYKISTMMTNAMASETLTVPSFILNTVYAYSHTYGEKLSDFVQEPYLSRVDRLFNKSFDGAEINAALTDKTTGAGGLFVESFINDLKENPDAFFVNATKANDLDQWAPQTAVQFLHCIGDEVIPVSIAEDTVNNMIDMGAKDIKFLTVEVLATHKTSVRYTHEECSRPSFGVSAVLLSTARKATIGY